MCSRRIHASYHASLSAVLETIDLSPLLHHHCCAPPRQKTEAATGVDEKTLLVEGILLEALDNKMAELEVDEDNESSCT